MAIPEIRFEVTPGLSDVNEEEVAAVLAGALQEVLSRMDPAAVVACIAPHSHGYSLTLRAAKGDLAMERTADGPDPLTAAGRAADALIKAVKRNTAYLEEHGERTSVMEMNLVARTLAPGKEDTLRRHFVKKLSVDQARAELDLSDEPGKVFFNTDLDRPCVMLNHKDGRFEMLEPGRDTTGGAGVETVLTDAVPSRPPSPPPEADVGEAPRTEDSPEKPDPGKLARFRPFLRCPGCRGEVEALEGALACPACGLTFPVLSGVPVMVKDSGYDPGPLDSPVSKNPYGQQTLQIIQKFKDGLVLDCGSGCPPVCFSNVVHLEIVRYPGVDIVAWGEDLPFAEDTFDAVISEAVLEHVMDPFRCVQELWRVLKPGGEIRVDAAFLQPYHAYPHHYFNMTISGLELLMKEFVKIESGCGPHQQPYVMLDRVLREILEGISDSAAREEARGMTLGRVLQLIEEEGEKGPFQLLSKEAISRLAAGFYFYGHKPEN